MRLIDADSTLVRFTNAIRANNKASGIKYILSLPLSEALEIVLNEAETVDPIKHGHWEESKCLDDCFWVCSCCKFPSQAIAAPKLYKYCPNCGARMDAQFGDSGL